MALSEAAIASLISGGFALAGTAGSSIYGAARTKKQMRYARELANQGMTQDQLQAFMLNAGEAQKARDFAVEMDSTNYQRKVADMQAAGVNPALAIGGVQAAPSSNAMGNAQANGPSSALYEGTPDFSAVAQAVGQYFQFKNMQKQNELLQKEIEGKDIDNQIKAKELKITPEKLQNELKEQQARIDKDSAAAGQYRAMEAFVNEQKAWYGPEKAAQILKDMSQVNLNNKQAKVAEQMYEKLRIECTWLPAEKAAVIANLYASRNKSIVEANLMPFTAIKQVTLKTARSMGINVAGYGFNASSSDDTLVLIVPRADGKGYDILGPGSADLNPPGNDVSTFQGETLDNTD